MTRQTSNLGKYHYEAVAAALKTELEQAERTYQDPDSEAARAHRYAVGRVVERLADIYGAASSPSRQPFDRYRFLIACGQADTVSE